MTLKTPRDEIAVLALPEEEGLWYVRSTLYRAAPAVRGAGPLGALAEYLSATEGDPADLKGLPRAARLQRAAKLLSDAARALQEDADQILDSAEQAGRLEDGGYLLQVREQVRRSRSLDVGAFAEAHPAEFRALASVPLGRADALLGRTEVDRYCSVEEQVRTTRKLSFVGGGGA